MNKWHFSHENLSIVKSINQLSLLANLWKSVWFMMANRYRGGGQNEERRRCLILGKLACVWKRSQYLNVSRSIAELIVKYWADWLTGIYLHLLKRYFMYVYNRIMYWMTRKSHLLLSCHNILFYFLLLRAVENGKLH